MSKNRHVFIFNEHQNGGEQLSLTTDFSNIQEETITLEQNLSLQSYGATASLIFFDLFTPDNLRKLAYELEEAMSDLKVKG